MFRWSAEKASRAREEQHEKQTAALRLQHDQELTKLISAPLYDSIKKSVSYVPLQRHPSLDLNGGSLGRGCGPRHLCLWGPIPAGLRPVGRKKKR